MPGRRTFLKRASLIVLASPLSGCATEPQPPIAEPDFLGDTLGRTKTSLLPDQMADARKAAKQFQESLDTVRNADIPYSLEPRFYPE